jgi:2-oxoglutarate ferredoxin oxidoreductase subunit alpha
VGTHRAGQLAGYRLFLGSYPITPGVGHPPELSKHKNFGVRPSRPRTRSPGIGAAIGAAFGGHLGVHHHERPGVALKARRWAWR